MPEPRDVELRIVLEDPTPGVWGGIQFGSGSAGTVKDWQTMSGPEAVFTATAQVKDGQLPLRGPIIQKDGKGRFLYIVWRDHTGLVSRRAKIYVETIDQAMLDGGEMEQGSPSLCPRGTPAPPGGNLSGSLDMRKGQGDGVRGEAKVRFEILLPGRAKDGLPCCATVKPLRDWRPIAT